MNQKKSSTKSSKNRDVVRSRKKETIVAAGEADKRFAEMRRAQYELDALNALLQSRDALDATVAALEPETEVRDIVERIHARQEKVRESLQTFDRSEIPVYGPAKVKERRLGSQALLFATGQEGKAKVALDASQLNSIIQAQQLVPSCPLFEVGIVKASDFRAYAWATPNVSGATGATAFWPLSSAPMLPNSTFTGDWTGEVGANFWGWVNVPGSWWKFDSMDSIAVAAVLQFTVPPSPCPSYVVWGTRGIADAPTPWRMDADSGFASTEWVLREDAAGGGFPESLVQGFQFIGEGLFQSTNDSRTVKREVTTMEGDFNVQPDVAPRVYLGCSLMCMAVDGRVSTIDVGGIGDHFEFEYGVTYIRVNGSN